MSLLLLLLLLSYRLVTDLFRKTSWIPWKQQKKKRNVWYTKQTYPIGWEGGRYNHHLWSRAKADGCGHLFSTKNQFGKKATKKCRQSSVDIFLGKEKIDPLVRRSFSLEKKFIAIKEWWNNWLTENQRPDETAEAGILKFWRRVNIGG